MVRVMLCLAVLTAMTGCSPPQVNTTRLGAVDLVAMTDQMAASLVNQPEIAARSADAEPWVVTIYRVINRTNDYLPEGERWAFVARLRAALARSNALAQRNIRWVLPAGREPAERGGTRATPTHALTATFSSLTIADRNIRSDTYVCAYQLTDLRNDQVIWEDRYEVKYVVERTKFD